MKQFCVKQHSIIIIIIITLNYSCKTSYSFTGIGTDAKTISIKYFQNFAPLSPPNLSQELTEQMKDIFLSQTNLKITTDDADLQIEGKIINYRTESLSNTGDDQSLLNRLYITVYVVFVNNKNLEENFEKEFTRNQDYSTEQNLLEIEEELTQQILEQLIQDILTESIGDW